MTAVLRRPDSGASSEGADCIRRGGVLLYPTETVYGLGGDAADQRVAQRIRGLKGGDAGKPMLVLTDEWERAEGWIGSPSADARKIMEHEPPLPVTLLLRATKRAPEHLIGPEGLVGIRRTGDPLCRTLVASSGQLLLSTSANPAGKPPPKTFAAIDPAILEGVDLAIDAAEDLPGAPSTIVRDAGEGLELVRVGALDQETIHEIIGKG